MNPYSNYPPYVPTDPRSCACPYCRWRGLLWPLLLICLGVLLLLQITVPGWDMGRTWPIFLIVIGGVKLFERFLPRHRAGA